MNLRIIIAMIIFMLSVFIPTHFASATDTWAYTVISSAKNSEEVISLEYYIISETVKESRDSRSQTFELQTKEVNRKTGKVKIDSWLFISEDVHPAWRYRTNNAVNFRETEYSSIAKAILSKLLNKN